MNKYNVIYISNLRTNFSNTLNLENFEIKYISYEDYHTSLLNKVNLVYLDKPQEYFIDILKQKYNYPETKFVISINDIYPRKIIEIINNYADEVILDNKNIYKELIKNGLNLELLSK